MAIGGATDKRVSWAPPQPSTSAGEMPTLRQRVQHQRSRSEGCIPRARVPWTRGAPMPSPRGEQVAASHRPQVPGCLEGVLAREHGSPGRAVEERAEKLLAGAVASIACDFMIRHPWAIDVPIESHHFQAVSGESPRVVHGMLSDAIRWIERHCHVAIGGPRRLQRIAASPDGTQGEYLDELLDLANRMVDRPRLRPQRVPGGVGTL